MQSAKQARSSSPPRPQSAIAGPFTDPAGQAHPVTLALLSHARVGAYLIEAAALDIDGHHWRPWLRLTRAHGQASVSRQTFDRLKPAFGNDHAALEYAMALGQSMADTEFPGNSTRGVS